MAKAGSARNLVQVDVSSLKKKDAREQAEALRKEIRRHDRLYYVKNQPEISDQQYDRLFHTLKKIEEKFPDLAAPDSPTQRVGAPPVEGFKTVKHASHMLSLESTYTEADIRRFDERMRKSLKGEVEYVLEEKLDGSSIELVYENGVLSRAVTRGDGSQGEEVTRNAKTIPTIPLRLNGSDREPPGTLAVRGEVIIEVQAFEELNQRLLESGKRAFANPRNAAAGSLRQLDPSVTAERPLQLVAYDILQAEGDSFETGAAVVEALAEWGFRIPEKLRTVSSADKIIDYHSRWEKERDKLDYEIDGVVIKVNNLAARERLGATSHHPRWAVAYKFEPRQEKTRVSDIVVQVGRTGILTPVALLRPVEVGDVTVSRASLHNRKEVERKDIRVGDLVRVQRAGDVIPEVAERIPEKGRKRTSAFRMPQRCPSCGEKVEEDGPRSICRNHFGCRAQLEGRIRHFVSQQGLDIADLGDKTVAELVDRGLVDSLAGIYRLDADDVTQIEGFAERSAGKLISAIEKSKRPPLHRFLYALGVPGVGAAVARDLAERFRTLKALRQASENDFAEVPGIGNKTAREVHRFLHLDHTEKAIDDLLAAGVKVRPAKAEKQPLSGKKFVFTGSLSKFSRSEAKKAVQSLGGKVSSSVSGETDYVVIGENPGQKADAAEERDVRTIDEGRFIELLQDAGYSED